MKKHEIIEKLRQLRGKDPYFPNGRILSSVSTKPSDIALNAFKIFSDVNALDSHIFPGIRGIERDIIKWFGKILKNNKISGYITTGGTEANITALWAAKKIYPRRNEIIVPKSAHYSIQKAADLMSLKIRWVGIDNRFRADSDDIKKKINKNTLAVIATAGTSALGAIDPVEEIDEFCEDTFFHVDAAFGGFMIPFLKDYPRIDFTLKNLDSITIDPHKMGFSLIPAGSILFRNKSYLKRLEFCPPYLPFRTNTLSGSRSGGSTASVYAVIKYYGINGYRKIAEDCIKNTKFLCVELEKIDNVSIVTGPELNIVGIKVPRLRTIYSLLRKKGWKISSDSETKVLRIVVMPHVTENIIRKFVRDLKDILSNPLSNKSNNLLGKV